MRKEMAEINWPFFAYDRIYCKGGSLLSTKNRQAFFEIIEI